MSKVITFSTKFPAYHSKAGQATFFVEKIFAGLADVVDGWKMPSGFKEYDWHTYYNCANPKFHTIRKGNRFKVGDKFSPRIWSGVPYKSKQIIFSPDIEVRKVWDFCFCQKDEHLQINDDCYYPTGYESMIEKLAKNDGLAVDEFKNWFNEPFKGQIICWSDDVCY